MGIQLDWEVEAEQSTQRSKGEDPEARRKRRRGFVRLMLTLTLFIALAVGAVVVVIDQVRRVNERFENNLRETVQAEVAALRIGDWNAFAGFQRSATDEWLRQQRSMFEGYQAMLLEYPDAQLTGHILNVMIEDPRARVEVQEIVGGVPYTRVWFYWLYEDDTDDDGQADVASWYHVPPDYTFWGDSARFDGDYVNVIYRETDGKLGSALGGKMNTWVSQTCGIVDCSILPRIRVQISPQDQAQIAWVPGAMTEEWVLLMSSPYADRARTDMPFSPELQLEVASLLAERLVSFQANGQRMIAVDAEYLYQAVVTWLVGQYIQVDTGAYLIDSLIAGYGTQAVAQMLRTLPVGASISFLSEITLKPLDQSALDWRDFFTWRLRQEQYLWERSLTSDYLSLYADDPNVQAVAVDRFSAGVSTSDMTVVSVGLTTPSETGATQVLATVHQESFGGEFQVLFRLDSKGWVRAS